MNQVTSHADRSGPVDLTCDVCIVGSGAGGAVAAATLASAGLRVVVLEAGPWAPAPTLTLQEERAMPRLYQERGGRSTADQGITVLQGRAVGGSTKVNWTTCYRTPDHVLDHWQRVHGLAHMRPDALAPWFDAVERRLGIHTWASFPPNGNNNVLQRGAQALGWEHHILRRNVSGCINSGYCGLGCPANAKQAMDVTFIQDALQAGARVLADVHIDHLTTEGERVTTAVGVSKPAPEDPAAPALPVTVRATHFISAAGAINGPALLLRSGITAGGRVGRRTFLHPVIAVVGEHAERLDPFYGAPQSVASHHFREPTGDRLGYFLEVAPMHPMLAGTAVAQHGPYVAKMLRRLPYFSGTIALGIDGFREDDHGGTVTLDGHRRPRLTYEVTAPKVAFMKQAHRTLAELQFAAGARHVYTLHRTRQVRLSSPRELDQLDALPYGTHQHTIFTAHQMGGCTMTASDGDGVVDPDHKVRGTRNLYVLDGSVLPTSLGVNPSETIYALSMRAASALAQAWT